jgi:hypothetical protein
MAKTPNYQFERRERDRLKAEKAAQKAAAKREQQDADRAAQAQTPGPDSEET